MLVALHEGLSMSGTPKPLYRQEWSNRSVSSTPTFMMILDGAPFRESGSTLEIECILFSRSCDGRRVHPQDRRVPQGLCRAHRRSIAALPFITSVSEEKVNPEMLSIGVT